MANLYDQKSKNVRKTFILMSVFMILIIGIGWFLGFYFDNPFILFFAVILAFTQAAISYWNSDKIALASTGAKEVERKEYFDLYNAVENISITAGIPAPRVYVIDDTMPNAFATGRDEKHAAVAVTTGLLKILDKSELEGVIAHEISHVKNRDILVASVVVVLVGILVLISDVFLRMSFFGGNRDNREGGGLIAVIGIIALILSPFIGMLIQLAISRKREFLADASGALLTRYPEGLASALEKINNHSGKMKRASNATAHLFIANPFGSRKKKGRIKLFMTHPPVEDRVEKLVGGR